jgi:hypothetical protein
MAGRLFDFAQGKPCHKVGLSGRFPLGAGEIAILACELRV